MSKLLHQRSLVRNTFRVASLGGAPLPCVPLAGLCDCSTEAPSRARLRGSYLLGQVAGQDWKNWLRAIPDVGRGLADSRATADATDMRLSPGQDLDTCRDTNNQGRMADQSLWVQTQ